MKVVILSGGKGSRLTGIRVIWIVVEVVEKGRSMGTELEATNEDRRNRM